jgi:hypothetical protein
VLGLLAITLAASYATLRGQASARHLARNTGRSLDARAAAESGMAAALRAISSSGWAGVDAPLNAQLTDDSWYEVAFTTGDTELTSGHPDYAEWPYRLTIVSTGYAADPADPSIRSVHRVRTVMQLVRKKFCDSPSNWTTLTNHSVYQWRNSNAFLQVPFRATGNMFIRGRLFLSAEYPQHAAARERYLTDLNWMRIAGMSDYRPLNGPLTIYYGLQDAATMNLLQNNLSINTSDTNAGTSAPLTHPGVVSSYRLYPGGKLYTTPVIQDTYGSTLSNVSLAANPQTNPLGLFRSRGALSVQSNVQIRGTVITDGASPEIQVYGTNVILEPANLPNLENSSQTWQLPCALVLEDLRIHPNTNVQMRGTTIVWDEFELRRGAPATQFSLTGNIFSAAFLVRGRDTWTLNAAQWQAHYNAFIAQWNISNPPHRLFFPLWMQHTAGFTAQPTLTVQPNSSGVRSRWQDWSQPVYVPDPADEGLRWNLVRYEDGV